MTTQNILQNFILPIITSGVVVWLLRDWISVRIRARIQHQYEQQLETHKARIKTESEKSILELQSEMQQKFIPYEAARISFMEGQKSSMERKLDSIDKLWACTLKLRKLPLLAMRGVDMFQADEVAKYKRFKDDFEMAEGQIKWNTKDWKKKMDEITEDRIEEVRPYIGEYLWAIFFSYQAICLRLYVLHLGNSDEEKLKWYEDETICQIIKSVLAENELIEFNEMKLGKFTWFHKKLEAKILAASRKIISGEEFSAESLKQAELIQEQATKSQGFTANESLSLGM